VETGEAALAPSRIAVTRDDIAPMWKAKLARVFADAGLDWPADGTAQTGGRSGLHTEAFGKMLAEMQSLARAHPGVTW
jgi:ring-1,2-phenylacetyl-CoA epoxidase subunit PaaC